MSLVSYASEVTKNLDDTQNFNISIYETSEEQYEFYINSDYATPEGIIAYEKMMKEHEEILNEDTIVTRASYKILGVPFYEQQNSYYCGPATVRQIRAYLTNSSNPPTQSQIATSLGTTTSGTEQSSIIDYLNSYCSPPSSYITLWKNGAYTSSTQLFNLIIADISANKPVVAHIAASSSSWRYSTSGHYLCFEGYLSDTTTNGNVVYIVDPWLTGHGLSNGKYTETKDRVYAVTDRIGS